MTDTKKPKSGDELRKEQAIQKAEAQIKAEELKKRMEAFNKELLPLLGKYNLGLSAEPMCLRLNDAKMGYTLGARPILVDVTGTEDEIKEEASEVTAS